MYIEVGVKILLKNNESKYLLIRRNPKKYPETGPMWDIVGGRITAGSPLLENLAREVQEEVGLKLTETPILVAAQDILGIERYPDRHVVRLTYTGSISGTPTIDDESIEYKWFTKNEILKLPDNEIDQFLKELIDRKTLFKE